MFSQDVGVHQTVDHFAMMQNMPYGPITYRMEVEGMGSNFIIYVRGNSDQGSLWPLKTTKYLSSDVVRNHTIEFTLSGDERIDSFTIGVMDRWRPVVGGSAVIRRISFCAVQDCVSAEFSDFSMAAAEDLFRLNVNGNFASTTAKFGALEERIYKDFNQEEFAPCDADQLIWRVAAVINGKKSTWNYNSNLWTGLSTFDDGNEKKTEAFNHAVSDQIRVKFEGMGENDTCVREFTYKHNLGLSLDEIFPVQQGRSFPGEGKRGSTWGVVDL